MSTAFIDEVEITVSGGNGGDGIVSFLRERSRPDGGPNGGDGGRGGDVVLSAAESVNTLLEFRRRRLVAAANGRRGMGKNRHGADGDNAVLQAPTGTRVIDVDTGGLHADLTCAGQSIVLAAGGAGGIGNARFKSSRNRAPRLATSGRRGERRCFRLELRLLADVGLLGAPNAGKSTLLRAMSAACPKVAAYPFTTLEPQLGCVYVSEREDGAVVADIPGLIRGAADGAGLGNRFLRHVSRTTLLCQVVDASAPHPAADCRMVDEELRQAAPSGLADKPRWLIMNKMDLLTANAREDCLRHMRREFPFFGRVLPLSALTGEGVGDAIKQLVSAVGRGRQSGQGEQENSDAKTAC